MTLDVKNIACRRGASRIFDGVTFKVGPGKVLYLTGPNGSGKTTLIRCLAGFLPPENGDVCWNGRDIYSDLPAYRKELQYFGQDNPVKAVLTVAENVSFWQRLYGVAASPDPALEDLGLLPLKNMPARFLSAGQKRRVGLARLLAIPARLWLLDEPETGLDESARTFLDAALKRHCAAGGCAVIATHENVEQERRLSLAPAA